MMAKSNAPRSLPASVSPRRLTGFLRPTYAPEPCGESCAIVSRPEFRSAPCDPRLAVSPAKSPCLLTFWLSCSPKRTIDLFPNGIDAMRTEHLLISPEVSAHPFRVSEGWFSVDGADLFPGRSAIGA